MINELISIGMPLYNADKFLEGAIQCLLAQSYSNFEIIISDNGSQDRTEAICRQYAAIDTRIKYHREKCNHGPSWNFNRVLGLAIGKYFLWAAHDDRWQKNFLAECVSVLEENEDAVSVFCNYRVLNPQTGLNSESYTPVSGSSKDSFRRLALLILAPYASMIYGLHRREMLDTLRIQNFDYADVFFLANLVQRGKIMVVPHFLYFAGVDGERAPYSINGKRIRVRFFLAAMSRLIWNNFGLMKSFLLLLLLWRFGMVESFKNMRRYFTSSRLPGS